jgi:hypothetical protein
MQLCYKTRWRTCEPAAESILYSCADANRDGLELDEIGGNSMHLQVQSSIYFFHSEEREEENRTAMCEYDGVRQKLTMYGNFFFKKKEKCSLRICIQVYNWQDQNSKM